MNLLEFGLENAGSESAVKKALAKGALAAEKKKADIYEAYLNRQDITVPEDPEGDAAMLKQIKEAVSQ